MKELIAVLGSLIFCFSFLPYIISILKGKTKPNLVTWFTWLLVISIATGAEFSKHEYRTAIFTLGGAIANAVIVGLSLKRGVKKYDWFDITCQTLALLTLVLWISTNSASLAVLLAISIDLIAALPTIRHSWLRPKEENWQSFAISVVGAVLSLFSLASYNIVSVSYPITIAVLDAVVALTIVTSLKRRYPNQPIRIR